MSATLDVSAEIEVLVGQLNADQLDHVGAILRARAAERRRQVMSRDVAWPNPDPETEAAFAELEPPLTERLMQRAERARAVGIDDDLIGCAVAKELLELGHDETEVGDLVARAGIGWHRRTTDERMVAAAVELLAMGMDPDVAEDAFAQLDVT